MGNQLTVQNIRQNLGQYKPDLHSYDLVQSDTHSANGMVTIWRHKIYHLRLIEKKYFVRTWIEFYELLEMFAFRYNDHYLLATKYLSVENQTIQRIDSSNVFPQTQMSIFYEQSITNLSFFQQIPQQDAAYFLLQSLQGFKRLVQKLNFYFQVRQEMFHITQSMHLKIWISEQTWQRSSIESLRPLSSESQMVSQILSIIQKNVYFCTESQKNLSNKVQNSMEPIMIEELINSASQTLIKAIQMTQDYFEKEQTFVEQEMTCLKDLNQEELISIMEMTRLKLRQNSLPKNLSAPQRGLVDLQHHNQPLRHVNSVSNVVIGYQTDYHRHPNSYGNLNVEQKVSQKLEKNFSVSNIQTASKPASISTAMRGSRSKSNKKSGLSLLKNKTLIVQSRPFSEHKKNSVENNNRQTTIVIRPNFNLNNSSGITLSNPNNVSQFPPKASKNAGCVWARNDQKQNYQNSNPFAQISQSREPFVKRNNSFVNVQHNSRGISITNKIQSSNKRSGIAILGSSLKKQNKTPLKINFSHEPSYVNVNSQSEVYVRRPKSPSKAFANNCSSISINSFPLPLYHTNSIVRVNDTIQTANNQNISTNMSFDPLMANQSLTRFHKEFIMNSSANSSGQQFYQIPKIYVHSPKAKNKIFRADTISQEKNYERQNIKFQETNAAQVVEMRRQMERDFVKEREFQEEFNRKQEAKRLQEFDSYIQENQSVFTHPVLYEYITNNSRNSEFMENQLPPKPQKQKRPYIDYLADVQISQSLDYHTAQKLFEINGQVHEKPRTFNYKENSPQHYTINDFPTIEQIEENPHDETNQKENVSFIPVPLNLAPQSAPTQHPPSSIRRGYEESMVVEYKKFYDDTNRSNNSPNKHYFSPLKKNNILANQVEEQEGKRKYATANNWKTSPSKPMMVQRPVSVHNVMIPQNVRTNVLMNQNSQQIRHNSPSPFSKIIFRGQKPAINPLLMQDIQKIRQNRMY